jgi:hypothetical protein
MNSVHWREEFHFLVVPAIGASVWRERVPQYSQFPANQRFSELPARPLETLRFGC